MYKQEILITESNAPGFVDVDGFRSWRIAIINGCEALYEENRHEMQRHLETDEVFVPIMGESVLLIGEERKRYELEIGKVYNVKLGTWHVVCMKDGAKLLCIEQAGTGMENSEVVPFE
ncbi:MAG: hypothetical protein E7400_07055 [Ruminococcaceae bacterium]|nr:hypothetical protein [Oscillospiraceae bacterium]